MLENLALNHLDKLATNAIIYKWWLRKDPRWKGLAQRAVTIGSSFAARLLLYEELNTLGKAPDQSNVAVQIQLAALGDPAAFYQRWDASIAQANASLKITRH